MGQEHGRGKGSKAPHGRQGVSRGQKKSPKRWSSLGLLSRGRSDDNHEPSQGPSCCQALSESMPSFQAKLPTAKLALQDQSDFFISFPQECEKHPKSPYKNLFERERDTLLLKKERNIYIYNIRG